MSTESDDDLFTVCVTDAGKPVRKTIAEMTEAEARAAAAWNIAEADRLARETLEFSVLAELTKAGAAMPDTAPGVEVMVAALERASAAHMRAADLMLRLRASGQIGRICRPQP